MPALITLGKWRTWVVVLCFAAVFGLVSYYESSLSLPTPRPVSTPFSSFSEERVRQFLRKFEAIGIKTVGSVPQEQQTVELILNGIDRIKTDMKQFGSDEYLIDVDVQHASGDYFYFRRGITTYQNVTNILVRLAPNITHDDEEEAYRFRRNGVLVSSHWDSALGSPGVSDDGANVASMIELIRNLVFTPSRGNSTHLSFPIIFHFNGAEEAGLIGAHGFVTGHKWSKQVGIAINLEAIGSGGPSILFQSGPQHAWLVKSLAKGAPYAYGTVMGQDLFQAQKIPGDTDYRVYRDEGKIPGLDIAYYHRGYVYHSQQDIEDKIDPGALQQLGENILGLLLHLLHNPKPHKKAYPYWLETSEPSQTAVFYNIPGIGMLVYNMETAKLIQSISATIAILLLTRLSFGDHFSAPKKNKKNKNKTQIEESSDDNDENDDEESDTDPSSSEDAASSSDETATLNRRKNKGKQKKLRKRRQRYTGTSSTFRKVDTPATRSAKIRDGLIGGVRPPPTMLSMFGGICTFVVTLVIAIAIPVGIGIVLGHPSFLANPMPWYHWEPAAVLIAFGLPSVLGIFLVHRIAQQPSVPFLTTGSVIYHSALTFWVTLLLLGTVKDIGSAYIAYWNVAALSLPPILIVGITKVMRVQTRTKRNLLWWMLLLCTVVPFMLNIHVTVMFIRLLTALTGRAVYKYPDAVMGGFCGVTMFLCLSPIMALQNNDPIDDFDIDDAVNEDKDKDNNSQQRQQQRTYHPSLPRVGRVSTVLAALIVFSAVSLFYMSSSFSYNTTVHKRSMLQHELSFSFSSTAKNGDRKQQPLRFENSTLILYGSDGHRMQHSVPLDTLASAVTTDSSSHDKFTLNCDYRFMWVPSSVIRANASSCDAYIMPRRRSLIGKQTISSITERLAPKLSVNTEEITKQHSSSSSSPIYQSVIEVRDVNAYQTQVDVYGDVIQLNTPNREYHLNNADDHKMLKCNRVFSPYTELMPQPCNRVLHFVGGEEKGTWSIVVRHHGPVSVDVVSTYGEPFVTDEIEAVARMMPVWMSSVNVVTSVTRFNIDGVTTSTR